MRKIRIFAAVALAVTLSASLAGCAKSDARKLYSTASAELEKKNYDDAATDFQKVIDEGYYLPESYRGLGLAQMCGQDYPDASISFEKSLLNVEGQSRSFQRDVNLYLAHCREMQGETEKALDIYNNLINQNADSEVLFLRGRLLLKTDQDSAAEADFDRAVQLSSDYVLYINIYEVYADEDKGADGSRYLEEALKTANATADDYYHQGLIHYYLQDYDDARDALTKALKADSEDPASLYLLGKVYLATGDTADARAVYKDYVSDKENGAGAYNGLALCDIADGNYDSALQNIKDGLTFNDSSVNQALLYNEIVVYEKQHDWSTATSLAASYIASYPSDEAGLKEYEFLSSRSSDGGSDSTAAASSGSSAAAADSTGTAAGTASAAS